MAWHIDMPYMGLTFYFFQLSNDFCQTFDEKSNRFQNIFWKYSYKVLSLHQYLWSEISQQWNKAPYDFFLICTKERCIGYSNGNESFAGSLFSNYRPLNMLNDISFIVFFTRLLSKCLLKNYPFSAQISKIHFKI